MVCSCFFKKSRNNHEVLLVCLIQKRKSENSFGEEVTLQRREIQHLSKNNRLRADVKGNETFIEEGFNQLFVLLWKHSDLDVDFFVEGKSEFPKNFSTSGERSIQKSIGTIFIALQLHWSNGY
jgi:hypothetical protein